MQNVGELSGLPGIPTWLRYDPNDLEQRRGARITIAILDIGGLNAILRQLRMIG